MDLEILKSSNINWIKMECYNNIAVCSLVLKNYTKVLETTKQVNKFNKFIKFFLGFGYKSK